MVTIFYSILKCDSVCTEFFWLIIFIFTMGECVCVHMSTHLHVEIREQLAGISWLLPPRGFWDQTRSGLAESTLLHWPFHNHLSALLFKIYLQAKQSDYWEAMKVQCVNRKIHAVNSRLHRVSTLMIPRCF